MRRVLRRPTRRARVALFLALGLTAASLTACSSNSGSTSGQTITVIDSSEHHQFKAVWNKIPQFTKQTGITVKLVQGDTQTVREKVLGALRLHQSTYDVVTLPDDAVGAAAPFLTNLDQYIGNHAAVHAFQAKQPKWAQQADTWQGKIKYYPFYAGGYGIAYRTDLVNDPKNKAAFQRTYGHPMQVPPKTSQDLLDLVRFLNQPSKRYGIVFPGQGETGREILEELIFRSALTYQNANGSAAWGPGRKDAQSRVSAAAAFLQKLVYKYDVAPREVTGMATDGASAYFENCQSAMYLDLLYLNWSQIKASESKCGPVSSFQIPALASGGGERVSFWMHAIPTASQHQKAAWKFLQWMNSEKNLDTAVGSPSGTFVPTNSAVAKYAVDKGLVPTAVVDAVNSGVSYRIDGHTSAVRLSLDPFYDKLIANQLTPQRFASQSGAAIAKIVTP